MKTQLLILLITISSVTCYSQITFEKGYYIDNSGQKVECQIKNIDWRDNPAVFEYRLSENNEIQKATVKSVKEFGIYGASKYLSKTVNIDRSSENIYDMSMERNPIFREEELFLKVLVEGKSNLYEYIDGNLIRYFYTKENFSIEQLIFKSYTTAENNIAKNNTFRQQLWNDLKCPSIQMRQIENMNYRKNDLIKFFVVYNKCNGESVIFEQKQKKDLFNLTLRPRLNSSSLKIQNTLSNSMNTDFGDKIGFGFGVEAEFILPFNKNKWSVILEPTYQHFDSEKSSNVTNVSGGKLNTSIHYKSIEVPLGIRYYLFVNDKSTFFVNASYLFDFNSKSSVEFTRANGSNLESLEIKTRNNLAMGIGYKHHDKYSVEVRYQTNREILGNYLFWGSEYKTLSVIFGYSLF